mgnify:CR=1 FL=1
MVQTISHMFQNVGVVVVVFGADGGMLRLGKDWASEKESLSRQDRATF